MSERIKQNKGNAFVKRQNMVEQHTEATVIGNISDGCVKIKNPDQSICWSEKTDVVLNVSVKEANSAEKPNR